MLKLHVLKPSVNNMAVRVFLRAADLDFEEIDAWGHTRDADFLARCPAHMTPMLEDPALPRGALWESCAIMQYLAGARGLERFYPADPGRRAMIDSALSYHTGTFYPLVARAVYPALGFPLYPGEVGASDAGDAAKAAAARAAADALAEPLEVFRAFFIDGRDYIGGPSPSIADIRLASTLEFLAAIDYRLPGWAQTYMASVEAALGTAYTEPAGDVRGYIQHVKSQAAG
jgi:glutathione S-transferase